MKKLTREEWKELSFVMKDSKTGEIMEGLKNLEVFEALQIDKDDWKVKSKVSCYVHYYMKRQKSLMKFTTRTLRDDKGWAIMRLK